MYEGIYLVFIRSLCIFVDILTVYYTFIFFNIKYEYNITLRNKTSEPVVYRDNKTWVRVRVGVN